MNVQEVQNVHDSVLYFIVDFKRVSTDTDEQSFKVGNGLNL